MARQTFPVNTGMQTRSVRQCTPAQLLMDGWDVGDSTVSGRLMYQEGCWGRKSRIKISGIVRRGFSLIMIVGMRKIGMWIWG